jgi:hypothetical protein
LKPRVPVAASNGATKYALRRRATIAGERPRWPPVEIEVHDLAGGHVRRIEPALELAEELVRDEAAARVADDEDELRRGRDLRDEHRRDLRVSDLAALVLDHARSLHGPEIAHAAIAELRAVEGRRPSARGREADAEALVHDRGVLPERVLRVLVRDAVSDRGARVPRDRVDVRRGGDGAGIGLRARVVRGARGRRGRRIGRATGLARRRRSIAFALAARVRGEDRRREEEGSERAHRRAATPRTVTQR